MLCTLPREREEESEAVGGLLVLTGEGRLSGGGAGE